MPNLYIDLQSLKGTGGLNIATAAYDGRLRTLGEHVCREIDRYSNRHYYFFIGTLNFDGDGSQELLVNDLVAIGTLQEDTNFDGTFETNWAAADYVLYPRNANPTGTYDLARPYTSIRVNEASNGG